MRNKRKWLTVLLCAIVMFTGCTKAEEDSFTVRIALECEGDVYAIRYMYSLGSLEIDGGAIVGQDGKPLEQDEGEIVFTLDDFDGRKDLSEFNIMMYIIDEPVSYNDWTDLIGRGTPAAGQIAFDPIMGREYTITVNGEEGSYWLGYDKNRNP